MRREKLVVPYRWTGGRDEDPIIVGVLSARRNLTTRAIGAYFRRN